MKDNSISRISKNAIALNNFDEVQDYVALVKSVVTNKVFISCRKPAVEDLILAEFKPITVKEDLGIKILASDELGNILDNYMLLDQMYMYVEETDTYVPVG